MRKRIDIGNDSPDTCGSCPQIIEKGDGIYCPSCQENYCSKCAKGGGNSLLGGLFRATLAVYSVGISEVIRHQNIKCPTCKSGSGLVRI